MESHEHDGIIRIPSVHTVDETVGRVQRMLREKGITLFALIDHSGEAAKAGMTMPATKLLIFGSPKAGTPVMLASPSAAIDLPLKLLVAEDAAGKVWISYNATEYLRDRHHLPAQLMPNLAAAAKLAEAAAG